MNPFNSNNQIKYDEKSIYVKGLDKVMARYLFFDKDSINWYEEFNRYGWINPFDHDTISKEFLFFTKPDLYLFDGSSYADAELNSSLSVIPFFKDAATRHKNALLQLQYSIKDSNNVKNPFMSVLSNAVTGKMDLSPISSEFQTSTPNLYGSTIDYRSNSIKSDHGYDFSLSVMDTATLEIYHMAKAYDEYIRMAKMGEIEMNDAQKDYIKNKIIPEQFSVYKFLIGSDGETILYYAKATGCFFVDVPRSDFSDPGNDGFKYSLSFHANFIEDNNPNILSEFNIITPASNDPEKYVAVHNGEGIDNTWARYPRIVAAYDDPRVRRRKTNRDYRLKWTNSRIDSPLTAYNTMDQYTSVVTNPSNIINVDYKATQAAASSATGTTKTTTKGTASSNAGTQAVLIGPSADTNTSLATSLQNNTQKYLSVKYTNGSSTYTGTSV